MKTLKHFAMMLVLVTMGFAFFFFFDDDEPFTDLASRVEGEYIGTLKPIGYTDEPARAYVSLVRVADDAVSFKCTCEAFDINPDPRNLVIEERAEWWRVLFDVGEYLCHRGFGKRKFVEHNFCYR